LILDNHVRQVRIRETLDEEDSFHSRRRWEEGKIFAFRKRRRTGI
jgi:hypothetical protein